MAESLRTQRERVKVAHDQVELVRPTVAQGFTSMTEFRRRQDGELSQQHAATDLYRRLTINEGRRCSGETSGPDGAGSEDADDLAVLRAAVADAEAAIAEAHGKQGYVVSAPVSGRVNSLQAWVGMNTETGVPFMSIVPDNAQLEVTLLVPIRAIGFVARNQQ